MGEVIHIGYFPRYYCVPRGVGSPAKNYLNLTITQAMTLFWRVRTWEGKCGGGWTRRVGKDDTETTTFSGGGTFALMNRLGSEINEERDMVCGNFLTFFSRQAGSYETKSKTYSATGNVILSMHAQFGGAARRTETTISPRFSLSGVGSSDGSGSSLGKWTLSFYGCNKSGPLYVAAGARGSAFINVKAKSYWSYGGKYDTSTGAPIDP